MVEEATPRRAELRHRRPRRRPTIALGHDELRERMSGNLCRCGAYNGIVDAIAEVYAEAGVVIELTYARAADADDAIRRAADGPRRTSAAAPTSST